MARTRYQSKRDAAARRAGWTHRRKGRSVDPYLKAKPGQTMYEGKPGHVYTDMDQKFRWIKVKDVVEL